MESLDEEKVNSLEVGEYLKWNCSVFDIGGKLVNTAFQSEKNHTCSHSSNIPRGYLEGTLLPSASGIIIIISQVN